jgi:hypothetical protein
MRWAAKIASGIGATLAGGAAWFYARERAVETPACETMERDGHFCVRRYPRLIVAEVRREGERTAALKSGFGLLADYIFAESRDGPAIAMTAPVLTEREGDMWRVRFVDAGDAAGAGCCRGDRRSAAADGGGDPLCRAAGRCGAGGARGGVAAMARGSRAEGREDDAARLLQFAFYAGAAATKRGADRSQWITR